jgi:hypothetical protein
MTQAGTYEQMEQSHLKKVVGSSAVCAATHKVKRLIQHKGVAILRLESKDLYISQPFD